MDDQQPGGSKMRRRGLFLACAIVVGAAIGPARAAEENQQLPDGGIAQCLPESCIILRQITSNDGFQVAIIFGFDRKTGEPKFVEAAAPPTADKGAGLTISFGELRPDLDAAKPQHWLKSFKVSFRECNEGYCSGRFSGSNLKADVIDSLLKYEVTGLIYQLNGEESGVAIKRATFEQDYKDLLAELKKPQ